MGSLLAPTCRLSLAVSVTILAAFAGLAACKREQAPVGSSTPAAVVKPRPVLGEISVQDLTPPEQKPAGMNLDVPALQNVVRAALTQPGIFAVGSPDGGAPVQARVRVELSCEDVVAGDKAAARAAVRLRIDTRPAEVAADHWNENVQAGAETIYKPSSKPDRSALFQRLAARTIEDLLTAYVGRQKLWSGDEASARAAIKADAGELRLEAIRVAGERKLAGASQELLALLDDPDESTRDAALGALVELRERRAVGVLASSKSMRDAREMRKILDAIATLGGPEAAEYLSFVAEGHEDPEIRTMATAARARLQRREGTAAEKK